MTDLLLLCECCQKQEATEIVEQETGGYSHWDGYVFTVEYCVCKDCLKERSFLSNDKRTRTDSPNMG